MQPPSSKGPPNPYAGRSPWGRAEQAPFRIGVGPGSVGSAAAAASGAPTAPPAPPANRDPGILGESPLLPRKPRPPILGADSAATVAPVEGPPADLNELLNRFDEEQARPRISRRMIIAGVAVAVLALIAIAAVVMARREAQFEAVAPEATATAPEAQLRPSVPAPSVAAPTITTPSTAVAPFPEPFAPLPSTPTYRATIPPPVTPALSAPAPVLAAPVLPPPEPVVIEPVAVPPPVRRPAPPPAARPAEDPDAPLVLRKGED